MKSSSGRPNGYMIQQSRFNVQNYKLEARAAVFLCATAKHT